MYIFSSALLRMRGARPTQPEAAEADKTGFTAEIKTSKHHNTTSQSQVLKAKRKIENREEL